MLHSLVDTGSKELNDSCHYKNHCHQLVCISSPVLEFQMDACQSDEMTEKALPHTVCRGSIFLSLWLLSHIPLGQRSADFSYEGPHNRYFRLCQPHVVSVTHPSSLSSSFFFVTLKKHKVHSSLADYRKTDLGPDVATHRYLPIPTLGQCHQCDCLNVIGLQCTQIPSDERGAKMIEKRHGHCLKAWA